MARPPRNPIPAQAADQLLGELAPLGDVTKKAMFGGYGLFSSSGMFAIIDTAGTAYLRADDRTSGRYESAGAEGHGAMPYWQIPQAVRDDDTELLTWAREAITTAERARKS